MKKALRKDFFREIQRNKSRFLSLTFIVALGVAFFCGIRSTEQDMNLSADVGYDEAHFMDIRVLGTLGVTDDDIEAIEQIDGVDEVEGIFSIEAFAASEETEYVLTAMTMTTRISIPQLVEGRLPADETECLLDTQLAEDYAIGDTITLYLDEEETLKDTLLSTSFTIVGFANNPAYLSWTRGSASIGNGVCDGMIYLLPDVFLEDYYTTIYVTVEGSLDFTSYTQAYEEWIDGVLTAIEDIADVQCELRYTNILADAEEAIDDAKEELAQAEADVSAELNDALSQLTQGEEELADAISQLQEGEEEIADGYQQLSQSESSLVSGRTKLEEAWEQYTQALATVEANETTLTESLATLEEQAALLKENRATLEEQENLLASSLAQMEAGESQLAEAMDSLSAQEELLTQARTALSIQQEAYEEAYEQYTLAIATWGTLSAQAEYLSYSLTQMEETAAMLEIDPSTLEGYSTLYEQFQLLNTELLALEEQLDGVPESLQLWLEQLNLAKEDLAAGEEELAQGWSILLAQQEELEAKRTQLLAASAQLQDGFAQLEAGEEAIRSAREELAQGWLSLAEARTVLQDTYAQLVAAEEELKDGEDQIALAKETLAQAEKELADAKDQIAQAKEELAQGWLDYEEGEATAQAELEDARQQIAQAEEELSDIEEPEWYVLDRSSMQSYVEYGMDAERIGSIGKVFPAFFFLVAALVALTTMTRMVEEERTQIGTLQALGYSRRSIAAKYLLYAISASLLGSIIGVAFGSQFLPWIIITAYQMMYTNIVAVKTPLQFDYALLSTLLAVGCTTLATWAACYRELRSTPAQLMRPAAPKQGKRVFLEKIPFLWKRLSFTGKSTIRNLFRYKKRFFMTVFGIGGCMALLMVGFGLRDSIAKIMDTQYTTVWTFQAYLNLDSNEDYSQIQEEANDYDHVLETLVAYQVSKEVSSETTTMDAYLFVFEDVDRLPDFILLRSRTRQNETYTLTDNGVVLTEKLATQLGVNVGDSFQIAESDTKNYTVTVTAITENYLYHYVYMTPTLYEALFGKEPAYNQLLMRMEEISTEEEDAMATTFLEKKAVTGVSFVRDMQETVDNMMTSLDTVIWVLIAAAGLLAFVVLYNLNNINITERYRELATLKVLGFYDGEVAGYVYRENILLTFFGILIGIVLGLALHQYIIQTVEVSMLMFGQEIKPLSYLYSSLLTILFSLIVNIFMFYSLKKIDMISSLKSVE